MYEVFTAVKVTHNATIETLELALVYSPNTSNMAGNVHTACGNYTSICSCNLNHLISLGGHLIRNKNNSFQIYFFGCLHIYCTSCVCVVVKH
jgi:hypothetical protein